MINDVDSLVSELQLEMEQLERVFESTSAQLDLEESRSHSVFLQAAIDSEKEGLNLCFIICFVY